MSAAPFWSPASGDPAQAPMRAFMEHCARATGRSFADPVAFHAFSVTEYRTFWRLFLDWSGVRYDGPADLVCTDDRIEQAAFFPDLRLNYAENLLSPPADAGDAATAIISCNEAGETRSLSRSDLRARVGSLRQALVRLGVAPGTVVAALARNRAETAIACLASTGQGALWSSLSPDLGPDALLSRFGQLGPTVLFVDAVYVHHGATKDVTDRIRALAEGVESIRHIVTLDDSVLDGLPGRIAQHSLSGLLAAPAPADLPWPRLPFNHPLFVLFSSGTTGAPKCLVHGHGGTLLEHLKEHRLHGGLGVADILYFHTSCGWMMWNWQLSALASGATIVLYDGSVSYPEALALPALIDRLGVTVFGTSPAYIQFLRDAGVEPNARIGFARLRAIQSTGSILYDAQYDWIRDHIKHVAVQSISGGSDIIGCFVLGHPLLPVHRGESQSVSLALDVRALTGSGPGRVGRGELVCLNPFPSRPVGLFGDADGRRFHDAYFAANPGIWTHGDAIELTEHGGARLLGRTDGTLKVHGVRIGPAEIYSIVLGLPGIAGALAIEQTAPAEPGGSRLVLLVVPVEGRSLDRPMTLAIKRELSRRASPNHVPAVIAQVAALPVTHNGKLSERAAADAINGRPVRNLAALKNPECLPALAAHPALQVARPSDHAA